MEERKNKRTILLVIAIALFVIISGIVFLSMMSSPAPIIAVNDGYDRFRAPLSDAKSAFEANEALFLDVRSIGEYTISHIPGATLIPLNDIPRNEPDVDKSTLIYTYCT